MGYKQSPFPMQQGTSGHASALKQKRYDNIEINKNFKTGKGSSAENIHQDMLESIDEKKDTKTTKTKDIHVQTKKEAREARSREKNPKKWALKDAKDEGKKSRQAERKRLKHERKLSRANETVAERKKRRKENYGSLYDDLDPIWRAMDQPRSTTATGYFDDIYKEEERQAEKDKRDTARAENKMLKKENKRLNKDFKNLENKYKDSDSRNPDNKKEESE